MNNGHRYILEPYKTPASRYTCPSCGKHKQFTRYINVETNEHLSSEVGKCNRDINCGYHYTPKQYFQDNPQVNHVSNGPHTNSSLRGTKQSFNVNTNLNPNHNLKPLQGFGVAAAPSPLERAGVRTIPLTIFKQSLKSYHTNNFIQFLTNLFGSEITSTLITKYYIGTSKHWNGSTVFWQIDKDKKIRTGKIMLFNPATGKRVKQPFNHITWVHTLLNKNRHCEPRLLGGEAISPSEPSLPAVGCSSLSPLERAGVRTCLFGEHLLKDTSKMVAIVESEKTAIIASVYLPNFIWLACGSLTNLTKEKCKILSGRKVILYPDLKCFEKWSAKASELSSITNFTVSDFLEKKATDLDKQSGLDIADYLIRFNHKHFVMPPSNRHCESRFSRDEAISPSEPVPAVLPPRPLERGSGGEALIEKIITSAPNILDHFELSTPKPIKETRLLKSPPGDLGVEPKTWNTTIHELESFFTSTQLPTTPIKINNHTTIIDVNKFIEAHLLTVKANNGNKTFLPYLERLIQLKSLLLFQE